VNNSVALTAAWNTFWGAINRGEFSKLMTIITVIGVLAFLFALVGFAWQKRKGGGGNTKGLWWALIIGALASAPNVLIPILLTIVDLIVNILAGFAKTLAG
jgi:hypothetical protein